MSLDQAKKSYYFDANASYGPIEAIANKIVQIYQNSANPNSVHQSGQRLRAQIENSRAQILAGLKAEKDAQLVFTSGATETNNQIILGYESQLKAGKTIKIVSTAVEHPCIKQPLERLKSLGAEVLLAKPNAKGEIEAEQVLELVTKDTTLVSIMAANNETGVMHPIAKIAEGVKAMSPKTLMHTDVAQLIGKDECTFKSHPVDVMSISGHKFGAPAGIGALVARPGIVLSQFVIGGSQELKLRAGTQNSLGILTMAEAFNIATSDIENRAKNLKLLRDTFESELTKNVKGVSVNCAGATRLPNTSSLWVSGVESDDLVVALDLEGVCISSGAACSSGKQEPSAVLKAYGFSEAQVLESIRVSFRYDLDVKDILSSIEIFKRCIERIRMNKNG